MNFKLEGIQDVINKLAKVEGQITREVDDVLQNGAMEISSRAKTLAPVYLGELQNSIGWEKIGKLKYEVAANSYHAPYIEFGTKRRVKIPDEMKEIAAAVKARSKRGTYDEFVDAMTAWIKKKGIAATQIVQNKSGKNKGKFRKASKLTQAIYERQLAFLMVKRILQNGMHPQPFLYPAIVQKRKIIIQDIRNVIDEKSG